jgi:hypothetical protein
MGANREPSNQSFEVDREATVCSTNRRFFLAVSFSPQANVRQANEQFLTFALRPKTDI